MIQRGDSVSLLELEAANYFKLDPNQVQLFNSNRFQSNSNVNQIKTDYCVSSRSENNLNKGLVRNKKQESSDISVTKPNNDKQLKMTQHRNFSKGQPSSHHKDVYSTETLAGNGYIESKSGNVIIKRRRPIFKQSASSPQTVHQAQDIQVLANTNILAGSSTNSTNSLPSISSSPSVSPSLVCPHLSIDDILKFRVGSKSPHTIGLCAKCRLHPPPNMHSPLSPAFKPSSFKQQEPRSNISFELRRRKSSPIKQCKQTQSNEQKTETPKISAMKRGYSDQQARSTKQNLLNRVRDDSLEYYLEPRDLRHLQMSPTMRNSVEYIRNNSIESGRVLKIYKNGQPFERPLRICITRGEFGTLNNLLDYINTRQLIPSGARYLFHMDGQLVYSVNELKHGSAYIVSGTRTFEARANQILKEQHLRDIQSRHLYEQRKLQTQHLTSSQILLSNDDPNQQLIVSRDDMQNKESTKVSKRAIGLETKKITAKYAPIATRPKFKTFEKHEAKMKPERIGVKGNKINMNYQHSRSSINIDRIESEENIEQESRFSEEIPVRIMRAKSELSALPTKRKKNVTFMDTGRGSSPAINDTSITASSKSGSSIAGSKFIDEATETNGNSRVTLDENFTNEVGIQVSDTIDGYLIDLPIEVPGDSETGDRKLERKTFNRSNQQRYASNKATGRNFRYKTGNTKNANLARPKAKIVTISERQLSLDEIDQLKDLDHGDHHSEANKFQHVTIKFDSFDVNTETNFGEDNNEEDVVPDRTGTINIGEDISGPIDSLIRKTKIEGLEENDTNTKWQYPRGREHDTTSMERPISQSDANESVKARVTTPTPSLSTMGDSNSLSMSYDALGGAILERSESRKAGEPIDLPPKQKVPVMGQLCKGVDSPQRNFQLTWVNGFNINDQYPENSSSFISHFHGSNLDISNQKNLTSSEASLLSPAYVQKNHASLFKLSDRFHNWVCHSRKHDELLYPVGTLVVLWCRWTEEQRYYSKHTANVSAIALASVDTDLAASAQLGKPDEHIAPTIHLWSLTTLETMIILDNDQFKGRRIFSLQAKNKMVDNCELSIGAKDDKRIWFYSMDLHLTGDSKVADITMSKKTPADTQKSPIKSSNNSLINVIKENKPLPPNQVPLLILQVPNEQEEFKLPTKTSTTTTISKSVPRNLVLSFGRRHFQLFLPDRKLTRLKQLLPESKSSQPQFGDMMMKATSFVRLAPKEFLIGDTEGNVAIVNLALQQQQTTGGKSSLLSNADLIQKYKIRLLHLIGPIVQNSEVSPLVANAAVSRSQPAITSLARVSGNLFACADSNCTIKFWKIERKYDKTKSSENTNSWSGNSLNYTSVSCRQVSCISLPKDLGFICTIVLSRYYRKQSIVEFYVVSTSNAILFGSVQLQVDPNVSASNNRDILANSSLSVVYEGHETSVTNLVADFQVSTDPIGRHQSKSPEVHNQLDHSYYFTCSLDCKICKWDGKKLVWKSTLPSACSSLAVHPTGFVLAIGSIDGTVYVLDKISGLLISYFPLTPVRINCLAYTQDGALLAAGCANGSIFILPVYESGLKYRKVSIFQSPHPVMSLQFSLDNRHILTSVTHDHYQELILWDLPNFRYMRDNVKLAADKIEWFDSICSGSEDVRAIWENANIPMDYSSNPSAPLVSRLPTKRLSTLIGSNLPEPPATVVNLSCHRLINEMKKGDTDGDGSKGKNYAIACDTRGYLRLFQYPCYDIEQGFFQIRVSSSAMNCCRFIKSSNPQTDKSVKDDKPIMFAASSLDGLIALWKLI